MKDILRRLSFVKMTGRLKKLQQKKDKVLVERIVSGVCVYERKQGNQPVYNQDFFK